MTDPRFPSGFLIGASTSAHQTEGNNVASDWWAFENTPGSPIRERSGDACDSLSRWREDMDLAARAGLNAYRFSIEWSRIEPVAGRFSLAAVDHYRRMVAGARERGLAPVVTLHHFTHPAWFTTAGGWLGEDAVQSFAAYVDAIAPVIDEGAAAVVTINEPNMVAIMHRVLTGEVPLDTGLGGLLPEPHEGVRERLIEAHRTAVERVRERHPAVPVGWSVANQTVQWTPAGEERGRRYRERVEDVFLRASAGDDFIGVQAYTRTVLDADGKVDQPGARTLTGWEVYPDALAESIRHTRDLLGDTPILVTENGIATDDDDARIEYTRRALDGVARCIDDGIDVRGYLHWSLLDNYEWGHWGPTFGLIRVDRETFERHPRPSLSWLGDLARASAATDRATP